MTTNNSTAPSSTPAAAPSSTPQDTAATPAATPSPTPAATSTSGRTTGTSSTSTGSDRTSRSSRTSQSTGTSSSSTTVVNKAIKQQLHDISLPTVGEIGLLILSFVSVAVLIGVSIYNLSLYNTIIAGYLPMPWVWLQRLVSWSLWALIQACELIAILIESETAFMALIAISASAFPTLSISGTNDPTVNKIQRRFNAFPKRWLFWAGMLSCCVFGLDAALVIGYFKPVTFSGILPSSIDLAATFSVILTVLLFQAAFMICLFSINGMWFVTMGRKAVEGGK